MITSKTKNENYLTYLLFEIIIVIIITFIATGFVLFYAIGRKDTRGGSQNLEYLFNNPAVFALLCAAPAVIAVSFVIYYRSRNYIIGFGFGDDEGILKLQYRKLINKTILQAEIPYADVVAHSFQEKKIFMNEPYKGKQIAYGKLNLDFVTNNFIWEEQPREKVFFLEKLNLLSSKPTSQSI